MTFSPPINAPEFRSGTLSPVSPKPLHYPSPSNIPILEMQMDPSYKAELPQDIAKSVGDQPTTADDAAQSTPREGVESAQASGTGASGLGGVDIANTVTSNNGDGVNSQSNNSIIDQLGPQPTTSTVDATSEAVNSEASTFTAPSAAPVTGEQQQSPPGPTAESQTLSTDTASGVENGGVDFQALLANLATPIPSQPSDPSAAPVLSATGETPQNNHQLSTSATITSTSGLPRRPPPQDIPITHPNYDPGDDIRSYHPHSQSSSNPYGAQSGVPPIMTTNNAAGGQPSAPTPSQLPQASPITPGIQAPIEPPASGDDEIPWTPELQTIYEQFLQEERAYVSEGQWDKFPNGSRMFIGLLPTVPVLLTATMY